ncbi:MAG TPA: Fe-S cluster assembly protein SufD [Stellaceae bacterium]|nr:Fe-S cluster assembly protein SufD [Stellaceae bacterium]
MSQSETAPYLDAFRARPAAREPARVTASRAAALARFAELGFPTRREEAWRFTDLRPLQRTSFPPAAAPGRTAPGAIVPLRFAGASHRLVFVDGVIAPELSDIGRLPAGAWLAGTAATLAERPELVEQALAENEHALAPFAALNAALFADGYVLALDDGVALERPVEVIHLGRATEPRSFHVRNAILLAPGSGATLVESFAGAGEYWTNAVTSLDLGDGAALAHVRIQDEGEGAIHLSLLRAALARKARYDAYSLTIGARLSRHDIQVRFDGEDGECHLGGAYLLRREQEATTATFVDHAVPGCVTRELYKGVVEDHAHGVFMGRILVRPDAQRSDAQQVNRNLLLSRRAAIDTKPELEILADDVKCSHGATVGDLDEEAMFYLRSRGIAEDDSRRLLIEAFAAETLERIEHKALRAHAAAHLARWLGKGE